ncbi:MAG: prolipoprotein diacylglyceryl transferase [Clostridia bacterium]|nr:prolipoprotein diacylglyceryl transferase [Clostridia bacterium]
MPGISRIAFELFGFPVYWYGMLIALGMLLGVMLASAREGLYRVKKDSVFNFVLIAIPAALVCARIYYVAFTWDSYAGNPMEIFNVRNGGMAIYGGVIGGVLTGWIYTRRAKISFSTLADLCAPALALGQAIGRWGNFFNQEAFGRAIESPSLCFFPLGVYIESLQEWHYATFFYESVWCFLIVAFILIAERKRFFKRPGDVFLWYLLTYSAERMVVEGMRTDSLYLGGIRISQLLSAVMLFACAALFLIRASKKIARSRLILHASLLAILTGLTLCALKLLGTPLQVIHALAALAFSAYLYKYNT